MRKVLGIGAGLLLSGGIFLMLRSAHAQESKAPADRQMVRVDAQAAQIQRIVDRDAGVVCYLASSGFLACVVVGKEAARDIPIVLNPVR